MIFAILLQDKFYITTNMPQESLLYTTLNFAYIFMSIYKIKKFGFLFFGNFKTLLLKYEVRHTKDGVTSAFEYITLT